MVCPSVKVASTAPRLVMVVVQVYWLPTYILPPVLSLIVDVRSG